MDMSAPGIQLNSEPQLTHFQPTIPQYLHSVAEAVMSNNLPAAQVAFAHLTKTLPTSAIASERTALATRVQQGVQVLGKALETGDLSAARQAVVELGLDIQSRPDPQIHQPQSADVAAESALHKGSDVPAAEGSTPEGGSNLNVRV
jgi:hypothetical protein